MTAHHPAYHFARKQIAEGEFISLTQCFWDYVEEQSPIWRDDEVIKTSMRKAYDDNHNH